MTTLFSTSEPFAVSSAGNVVATPEGFKARVVSVIEGDTLVVLKQGTKQKIRLNGIDCPEHDQPFGFEARQVTADLTLGKDVLVKKVRKDHQGRLVADVTLPDGQSLAHTLVRAGLAWWYRKYSSDPVLAGLEAEARAAKRGLWAKAAVPPEQWRRGQRDLGILR